MTRLSKTLFVAAALIAAPFAAFAEEGDAPEGDDKGGEESGEEGAEAKGGEAKGDEGGAAPTASPPMAPAAAGKSFLVPKGTLRITGQTLAIGLFPDYAGKPIALAPAIYYGISDKLNLGITHDGGSTWLTPRPAIALTTIDVLGTPLATLSGRGICLTGTDGYCPEVYNNIGFDALFSLVEGDLALAAHGGLDINSFDPFTLSLRVGALGRFMATDKLSVVFDPRISVGITERDALNEDMIDVPFWVWFQAIDKAAVYLSTGITAPLDGFGDKFEIPVGFGANYIATQKVTVGADFSFLNLGGKNGGTDDKMVGLRAIIDI